MPVTVWAYRVGNFSGRSGVWNVTIHFNKLSELCEKMREMKLGTIGVKSLAVVAHGNTPGTVQLDKILTGMNIKDFSTEFDSLNGYIIPRGKLIFIAVLLVQVKWETNCCAVYLINWQTDILLGLR